MPGAFTDYLNNKLLDVVLGGTTFVGPSTLFVGLSITPSNKAGVINEPPIGIGYSRVAVVNTPTNFPASTNGSKSNANPIAFPTPTGSWGNVVAVFLADANSGGNILAMADLSVPKAITVGTPTPTIAASALFLSHT